LENKKHIIVIQGPTASGKTSLSIALAKEWNCAVLSADSRQFYKEVSIGTAKPSMEEREGISHHFIDSHSVEEPVSAAQFEKEALIILEKEFEEKNVCIVVGGSGLFIDALCDGLDPLPSNSEIQKKWQDFFEKKGLEQLQDELKKADPEFYEQVDKQNPHRIIRALEILTLTGKKMSDVRKNKKAIRPFEIHRFVITLPREKLYERINQRVLEMINDGLVAEAKKMIPFEYLQSLNTVGYKELFVHFKGETDLESAIAAIQQNSRRYAKRQLTWFRRNPENKWLHAETLEKRQTELLAVLSVTPFVK
jgi:tRNA dimethylallyltransferase